MSAPMPMPLTQADCEALTARVLGLVTADGAEVRLYSGNTGTAEFARGDTNAASESPSITATLMAEVNGRRAIGETTQVDEAGLRTLVTATESLARDNPTPRRSMVAEPRTYVAGPPIFFDATVGALDADAQRALVQRATDAADAAGLVAAGTVNIEIRARAIRTTLGMFHYERATYGEFSVTARGRAPDHRGSGWAWSGFEDWGRVDTAKVIAQAVDIGARSANPVAIEPGRYSVILEPAAVAALIAPILGAPTRSWSLAAANTGGTVFAGDRPGTNKIGLQMLDRRLSMISNPWDPERPASTITDWWRSIPRPVTWFEHGVLQRLADDAPLPWQSDSELVINPGGVRLEAEGPTQTLEAMIANTKRGLWIHRLSHVALMNQRLLLLTGTTRDGAFLVENGTITKAIKNLRFTDTPFFVLNGVEAWGAPVRAAREIVAPRLMVRDFNFTSGTDAV